MREVAAGLIDYTVFVKIALTTGAPATGLAYTDIDIAYTRLETDNDVTTSDVVPANLSALTDVHLDWGWKEISAADHPGLYRLDIADAVFASGAWEAVVTITDASGTDFHAVDIGFRLGNFPNNFSSLSIDGANGRVDVGKWMGGGVASTGPSGRIEVDVEEFGGEEGMFSEGKPEVIPTGGSGGVGTGDIAVNHDYGGVDTYRVLEDDSDPADGVAIRAYVQDDYDAGTIDSDPPLTYSGSDGRWISNLMLDADTYILAMYYPVTKRTTLFRDVVVA